MNTPTKQLNRWLRYYYWDTQAQAPTMTVLPLAQATRQGLLSHTVTADISAEQLHVLGKHYGDEAQLQNILKEL